jgi:hypothetical protein
MDVHVDINEGLTLACQRELTSTMANPYRECGRVFVFLICVMMCFRHCYIKEVIVISYSYTLFCSDFNLKLVPNKSLL